MPQVEDMRDLSDLSIGDPSVGFQTKVKNYLAVTSVAPLPDDAAATPRPNEATAQPQVDHNLVAVVNKARLNNATIL